jgi:hypothetical protein
MHLQTLSALAPSSERSGSIALRSNNRGPRAERVPTDGDTDYCENTPLGLDRP